MSTSIWSVTVSGKRRLVHALAGVFILQAVSADGKRLLLTARRQRTRLAVRLNSGPPKDFSWFDWTFVSDISPDGRQLLFWDYGPTKGTSGSWIRSIDGGDAIRVGEGSLGKFSPDGRWIVALTPEGAGPLHLLLHPTGPGQSRQVTFGAARDWAPSFAGAKTLLFVRSNEGKKQVWRVATDGTAARALGAECNYPAASPSGDSFICIGPPAGRSLFVYPIEPGPGRKLYEVAPGATFRYARWAGGGDRVLAATSDRRVLAIDARDGSLISEASLPLLGSETDQALQTAAFDPSGAVQAYSVAELSSELYLASGLR